LRFTGQLAGLELSLAPSAIRFSVNSFAAARIDRRLAELRLSHAPAEGRAS